MNHVLCKKATRLGKPVVTEVVAAPQYFKAEDYHQQYLSKVRAAELLIVMTPHPKSYLFPNYY
jgi:peptide methionine sulfoxide reductase MsrA